MIRMIFMILFQIGISRPSEEDVTSGYAYAPDNFIGVFTTDTFSMFQSSGQQVIYH